MEHAHAAAGWLARAQDATACGGVAQSFYPVPGRWAAAYPETSGYIIGSMLKYADRCARGDFADRARRVAEWLLEIQLTCGGIQAGTIDAAQAVPTIFNTGQVVHGWVDAYRQWGDERYAVAAVRACRWLIDMQDDDGCWRRGGSPSVVRGKENVYNVRTAWAMIRAGLALDERAFVSAAARNFQWAATQERAPGWLDCNDFDDCARPILHTVAYAAESFLEAGLLLEREDWIALARRTCEGVIPAQRADGHFPGRLDASFRPAAPWVCLTGDAQMLLVFLRAEASLEEARFKPAAEKLSKALRSKHALSHAVDGAAGALAGSHPFDGAYMRYAFPNWATKFFLDAMLEEANQKTARPVRVPAGGSEGPA